MIKQKLMRGFLLGLLALGTVGPASAALPIVDSQGQSVPSLAPMLQQVLPAVVNISSQGRVRVADNPLMQDPFFRRFFGVPVADSSRLRVGDFVVAIGNPFGLGQTVTSGIVSALGRTGLGIEGYEDFIQPDASINPGNSGGALVNLRGELIGINTAILAPGGGNVGIGFAIPVNMARQIMDQLIQHGEVRRGRLGVMVQDLTPELAKAFDIKESQGAVIAKIVADSPAAKAGLKAGDVVTRINGKQIITSSELRNIVGLLQIGETVALDILRDGKPRTVKIVLAEPLQEKVDGKTLNPRLQGAVFGSIDENTLGYGQIEGVLVTEVKSGTPAWRAGLRKGDVVMSVNRQPVANLDELKQVVKAARGGLLFNLRRGDGALFVLIQ